MKINIKYFKTYVLAILTLLLSPALPYSPYVYAKAPEAYASSSRLASGKWVKIKVTETGIQTLTTSRLRQLGFSDPSKVKVYGYGGRMIADALDDNQKDDLPQLPVVRTPGAILFYGVDNIGLQTSPDRNGNLRHIQNSYASDSFYFLSDMDTEDVELARRDASPSASASTITSFRQMILHEKELTAPAAMGRMMVGEDFRTSTTQSFPFTLVDKADEYVYPNINFVAHTTGSSSSVAVYNGDTSLGSAINISPVTGEMFINVGQSSYPFKTADDKINLRLVFKAGGMLQKANLDWIEVFYNRSLKLRNSQLYFYNCPTDATNMAIEGCNESTRIWDVTDPAAPVEIQYTLNGSVATFLSESGFHEYVAFNEDAASLQPVGAGAVANQDIHALPVPDMLIISPSDYTAAAERVANLHRDNDGMIVHVISPEKLYNEFSSGVRDINAYRKAMKMWYDRGEQDGHKLRYCLLMGRPAADCKSLNVSADGVSYPVMLTWQTPVIVNQLSETTSYSTDDYYGMLDDSTPTSFDIKSEKIRVAVGRFPVKTPAEANAAADKLEKYINKPNYGKWRNRLCILADDGDGSDHLDQAQDVYANLRSTQDGKKVKYERIYLDSYKLQYTGTGAEYTDARTRFYNLLDEGINYLIYIGHGNTRGWGHEKMMTWTDLTSLTNVNLPVINAATCDFGKWDDTSVSGAEVMWLNNNGGAIAFIGTNRKVWVSENGVLLGVMAKRTFQRNEQGAQKRLGDFFIEGKNDYPRANDNKLRYTIIGDPAIRVPFPALDVNIDEIAGETPENTDDMPIVKARQKFVVKGSITDAEGNPVPDFNGAAEVTLMDAEVVVETLGQNDSEVRMYNDHKTQLYSGKTIVTDGKFELTVTMPSEVDNNFTPALINIYAIADDGREAGGSFSQFYVYGYDDDAEEDNEGPVIESFALNTPNFEQGGVTHDTPLVLATLADPSGINLSEGGIGHKLSLVLDEKTVYDNLVTAFVPDANDYTRGKLAYVMPSIEPGDHTLRLTAWDNANNSSSATIIFKVAANRAPTLYDVTTTSSAPTSSVTFILSHDRPSTMLATTIDVYDLNGRKVWSKTQNGSSGIESNIEMTWDLTDISGERVPRGIYIYKATVTTKEGTTASKSKKLAVAAP